MFTPVFSSPSAKTSSKADKVLNKATPPTGTIPSSTAALVACKASSNLCCFAFCSISVAAPTFITPTPPPSFSSLLFYFFFQCFFFFFFFKDCFFFFFWKHHALPAPAFPVQHFPTSFLFLLKL